MRAEYIWTESENYHVFILHSTKSQRFSHQWLCTANSSFPHLFAVIRPTTHHPHTRQIKKTDPVSRLVLDSIINIIVLQGYHDQGMEQTLFFSRSGSCGNYSVTFMSIESQRILFLGCSQSSKKVYFQAKVMLFQNMSYREVLLSLFYCPAICALNG